MVCIKTYVGQHKRILLLFMATLTIFALTFFVRMPSTIESVMVTAEQGVYQVPELADANGNMIRLVSDHMYYPNVFLTPETADTMLPEWTEKLDNTPVNYLSQRFVVLVPETRDTYTMTFKLSGRHAMRVYVNGKLAAETGQLGTIKQTTEVWENNITFHGSAVNGKMDIILNSAQFYHVKRGASLAELRIEQQGITVIDRDRIKGLLIMGALLSAAISLFGIYWIQMKIKATLYFALACIAMALRECIQSQAWVYFPISGNLSFMLEYMSMVLLVIFLCLYLQQYTLGKFLRSLLYLVIGSSVAFGLCVLFGDSRFYTTVLKYYQFVLLFCIMFGIGGLVWKLPNPNTEQAIALYGIAVFYLSAIADLLMYLGITARATVKLPISEVAMLTFAIAQVFSLYFMNHRLLSEAKEAEQMLAMEKLALTKLDQMKTEFLGNVSHELKTPLTIIAGYAQNAQRQLDTATEISDAASKMAIISSEAKRLGIMVGQILDVTCIEENRMHIEVAVCSTDELIDRVIATYFPILNKNHNQLELQLEENLPDVMADAGRISQVLVNVISNAARFTMNGQIIVSAFAQQDVVVIDVTDTGSGISKDLLPHVFDRYMTNKKNNSHHTGTGLGLFICHYIVTAHGGLITIDSEVGKGTTVRFTLPIAINSGFC